MSESHLNLIQQQENKLPKPKKTSVQEGGGGGTEQQHHLLLLPETTTSTTTTTLQQQQLPFVQQKQLRFGAISMDGPLFLRKNVEK
jgi:hypothetical protein